ncbi:hypothetical protein, partial [Staphylococcus aureus]|uniref:hypothetical protein n=1 Tax=Staphylococcus aureus TaxID=1280 RepID=UPI001C9E8EA4
MQVGGAPTERNRITNFNRQCKLGWGPTQKLAKSQHTKISKWAGPHRRKLESQIQPKKAIGRGPKSKTCQNVSFKKVENWVVPTLRKLNPQFLRKYKVGLDNDKDILFFYTLLVVI